MSSEYYPHEVQRYNHKKVGRSGLIKFSAPKSRLISIILACFLGVLLVWFFFFQSPLYQAQIQLIVAQEDSKVLSATEPQTITKMMDLLGSDEVLAEVVKTLDLHTQARPHYFPGLGEMIVRYYPYVDGEMMNDILFGGSLMPDFRRYAWHNEYIEVSHFSVENLSEVLDWQIVKKDELYYQLLNHNSLPILTGQIGEKSTYSHPEYGEILLNIKKLIGKSKSIYTLSQVSIMEAVESIKNRLVIQKLSEPHKKAEHVVLSISAPDPVHAVAILETLITSYQNLQNQNNKAFEISNVEVREGTKALSQLMSLNMSALFVLMGILLSLLVGVWLAFRKRNREGLNDPKEIEAYLGHSVLAAVPLSKNQAQLKKIRPSFTQDGHLNRLLARQYPNDLAIEALRSFRTALKIKQIEANNTIIAMSSYTSKAGKSFISANLALVLAETGKRVLLIDADFAEGRVHKYFESAQVPGLSELIMGQYELSECLHSTAFNIDFIPRGTLPKNAAKHLQNENCERILKQLASVYDIVLVDAPPIIPLQESLPIHCLAGHSYLVLNSGQHTVHEIKKMLNQLERQGATISGFLLNRAEMSKLQDAEYDEAADNRYDY